MNARGMVTVALLGVVVLSVAVVAARGLRSAPQPPSAEVAAPETAVSPRAVVYYFHGNVRCRTCRAIEVQAHDAVNAHFAAELASGELEWRTVNVDDPAEAHYIDDFQLSTRAVVVAAVSPEGKLVYKNLERVWELVDSEPAFGDYIASETRAFVEALR